MVNRKDGTKAVGRNDRSAVPAITIFTQKGDDGTASLTLVVVGVLLRDNACFGGESA